MSVSQKRKKLAASNLRPDYPQKRHSLMPFWHYDVPIPEVDHALNAVPREISYASDARAFFLFFARW